MKDSKRLKNSFEFIRKDFFPRWDKKKNWIVRKVKLSCSGRCNRSKKTIEVWHIPSIQNSLYFLLIHEICHAVSTDRHGPRWKARMVLASERAKRKGNNQLSKMILNDLENLDRFGETERR